MQNVNLTAIEQTIQKAASDPKAIEINMDLTGSWRMDEEQAQFGGTVQPAAGAEVLFESDFPPFLGGKGSKPTPLMYCFWGGMACLASTFALTAATEKVEIKEFSIRTTGTIDFHQALGISNVPPIRNLTWELTVETDASQDELDHLMRLTEERCPASWMMQNIVPFQAKAVKKPI